MSLLSEPALSPGHVLMVRPHRFRVNPDTAADNAFQLDQPTGDDAAERAYQESTRLAEALTAAGVGVSLIEDELGLSPDSVFPNNWFTTHPDGRVVLCPMFAPNRRQERRDDVVSHLCTKFRVGEVLDLSAAEDRGQFLEGTGSVVIDHERGLAYACRSNRLSPGLFRKYCRLLGLEPVLFEGTDSSGIPVFHTNIMLSVGQNVVLIGSELIRDRLQRERLVGSLRDSGRTIVELTEDQVTRFAGNALELTGADGPVLAMSDTALSALRSDQMEAISRTTGILSADVSTIETSGGSVRCMLAGIHLPPR
ncbi:citrulline utilization hydrolase CtlX [Nesterenkonia ebinurensis]|uniref:citrulline utilization hydrolase CtlX n=1 Tax=Nesterenkonia ebinurensis TaxID=2608252 RepID=UPI00168AAE69|nr:arginine deiminase-related protein [Nesterenkonia ebinurensis]